MARSKAGGRSETLIDMSSQTRDVGSIFKSFIRRLRTNIRFHVAPGWQTVMFLHGHLLHRIYASGDLQPGLHHGR